MVKREASIRRLGLTYIAVDKPLRADIKAAADVRDMTMVGYLRMKVNEDKVVDRLPAPETPGGISERIKSLVLRAQMISETYEIINADIRAEEQKRRQMIKDSGQQELKLVNI